MWAYNTFDEANVVGQEDLLGTNGEDNGEQREQGALERRGGQGEEEEEAERAGGEGFFSSSWSSSSLYATTNFECLEENFARAEGRNDGGRGGGAVPGCLLSSSSSLYAHPAEEFPQPSGSFSFFSSVSSSENNLEADHFALGLAPSVCFSSSSSSAAGCSSSLPRPSGQHVERRADEKEAEEDEKEKKEKIDEERAKAEEKQAAWIARLVVSRVRDQLEQTSSSSSSSSSAGSAVCLSDLPSSLSVKIANAKQATLERSVQDRLIPHLEKSVEDLGALLRCIQAAKSSARQNLSTLRTNTKTPSLGRICQAIQKELQEEEEEKE